MSFKFLTIFALLLILHTLPITCCIFSYKTFETTTRQEAYRIAKQTKNFTRTLSKSNPGCFCGADYDPHNFVKPWVLYVHFRTPVGPRICPGTIINSNQVITSHSCLRKSGRVEKSFPVVAEKVFHLPEPEELTLSTHLNWIDPSAVNFYLKKIIYRNEYPAEMFIKNIQAPESDVAILVVNNTDFNNASDVGLAPICVPRFNDIPLELMLNREGFYQGIRGWDHYKYKYDVVVGNFSYIMTARECNKRSKQNILTGSDETICLRFFLPGPTTEGGALRLIAPRFQSEDAPVRSYLAGIATYVDRSKKNAHYKYAYFGNINYNVKYIEEKAIEEKSEWCETPPFFEKNWPWANFKDKPDESLDCVWERDQLVFNIQQRYAKCGKDLKKASSRIHKAPNANHTYIEFPYLAKIFVYTFEKEQNKPESSDLNKACSGSIINSKIILTAASCILNKTRAKLTGSNFNVLDHLDFGNYPELGKPLNDTFKIILRSFFFNTDFDEQLNHQPIYATPEKIVFHPAYTAEISEDRFNFDIALIILKESIEGYLTSDGSTSDSKPVKQICLPSVGNTNTAISKSLTGTINGWGEDTSVSPYLKKTEVRFFPMELCTNKSRLWGPLNNKTERLQFPSDTLICAGNGTMDDPFNSPTPVEFDAGAPLVVSNKDTAAQLGIFSTFVNFIESNSTGNELKNLTGPSYYVNVEAFLPFINYYSKAVGAKGCRQKALSL